MSAGKREQTEGCCIDKYVFFLEGCQSCKTAVFVQEPHAKKNMVLFYSAFNAKKKQFMKKKMYPSNSALRKKNWS